MNPVDGSPDRLFLRPFKERNLALYAEINSDPAVVEFLGMCPSIAQSPTSRQLGRTFALPRGVSVGSLSNGAATVHYWGCAVYRSNRGSLMILR
jgi:hypothetical protein